MFEGIKTSLDGSVVYVVYDDSGRILNSGCCQLEAVKLCAAGWKGAKRQIYDALTEIPNVLTDRVDVESGRILRGVCKPGAVFNKLV